MNKQVTRFLLPVFVLLSVISSCHATYQQTSQAPIKRIHEVRSVAEIHEFLKYIPQQALCIVDIDDTVTNTTQLLGSSRWAFGYWDHLAKKGLDKEQALTAMLAVYVQVQHHTKTVLVEGQHTAEFIQSLHDKHHVLFITARESILAPATERQFSENKLTHNHSQLFKHKNVAWKNHVEDVRAINGIVYVSGGDKGQSLAKYLAAIDCEPTQFTYLIGIDDKEKHLHQLADIAHKRGINFIGFRYGALDHIQQQVNLDIAKLQYKLLQQHPEQGIISDEQAAAMLQTKH